MHAAGRSWRAEAVPGSARTRPRQTAIVAKPGVSPAPRVSVDLCPLQSGGSAVHGRADPDTGGFARTGRARRALGRQPERSGPADVAPHGRDRRVVVNRAEPTDGDEPGARISVVVGRVGGFEIGGDPALVPRGQVCCEEALADTPAAVVRVGGEQAQVGVLCRNGGAARLEAPVQLTHRDSCRGITTRHQGADRAHEPRWHPARRRPAGARPRPPPRHR